VAVEPLVRAAERHPDLMTEVVGVLASGDKMRRAALPHLRRFFGHDNPEVRAAALQGLGACVQADDTFITPGSPGAPIPARSIDAEIRAGLQDKSSVVRQAGAALVFNLLNQQRPSRHSSNASLWEPSTLSKFHNTGFTRPAWLTAYADLVQAQLAQEEPAERVQAALALVALGRAKEGLPLLTQLGVKERELRHLTDSVLPWLEWEQRSDLFDRLLASEPEPGEYYTLLRSFAEVPDRRTIDRLWAALAAGHGTEESATYFLQTLEQLYYGSTLNRYVNGQPQLAKEGRKEAAAAAVARVAKGPDMLRLVALLVLVRAAPDQVAAAARPVVEDRSAPAALRRDAFQLMLQGLGKEEKEQTAVAALGGDDEPLRLEALAMLAGGLDSFRGLREGKIYFSHTPYTSGYTGTQGSLPQVPRGLDAALLRPYLTGADPQNAARAGYLLALLKDPAGLDALLRQWRAHDKERAGMTELLYRAVASLGDDALVPVLEEIYRTYSPEEQQFNISDFYWTIRSIEGPAALRLRKQIRDDIGTENLR
jgi:hypothetical protein